MNIAVVGTGYVGLVSGTCFAEMGAHVTCIDIDKSKIDNLKKGIIPIYEPGLDYMLQRNINAGRLRFATELSEVLSDVEVVFSCVGTPPDEDGSADLQYVLEVARNVGKHMSSYLVMVTKSTVPVGTGAKVKSVIEAELKMRGVNIPFDVASNPEFLKEGAAIRDFMSPDRVVVGVESDTAKDIITRLYKPFLLNSDRMIFTDIPSAEMIKYAANSMLATRISFMNDIANLCELVGADINMVRKGIGTDTRIGKKFLYAGCGYGGSCFPKDVKALIKTAEEQGYSLNVLKAVEDVNDKQKEILYNKFYNHFHGDVQGKTVALWGLAFKPDTDDMREAPAVVLINRLLSAGCKVKVYDPIAMHECKRLLGNIVSYCENMYDATHNADALMLVTEWKEFRLPNWALLKKSMTTPLVLDGRNIYDIHELTQKGLIYKSIGR